MTSFFLRLYRIPAILLWSVFLAVLSIPWQIGGRWKDVKRLGRLTTLWNKGIAGIINLKIRISGEMPDLSGGVVVSNHLGYLDIVTHGSLLPMRYSPRVDIGEWPILGWYIGLSRPVWLDRRSRQMSKKTFRDFAKTVKRGMFLIVYPEGTSTDGRHGVLPFKSTVFESAIAAETPIIPMVTSYRVPKGGPEVCWYGDMTLLPHMWNLLGAPYIEARLHFLKPIFPRGMSRKELALFVHDTMEREYLARFSA